MAENYPGHFCDNRHQSGRYWPRYLVMKSQALLLPALALLAMAPRVALGQPIVSVVAAAPSAPVAPGQSVTMSVSATGSSMTYQWKLDGANIPGAIGASYVLPMVGAADRGSYQVVVTGAGGTTTVDMGPLAVMPSDARLMNFSGRAMVGSGSDVMIAGFVSRGEAGSTNKNILFRGMGPALGGMGMSSSGVLANPVLTIYDGQSSPMGSNMGWTNAPSRTAGAGASRVQADMRSTTQGMMNAVGAFTTGMGSADSAVMERPARCLHRDDVRRQQHERDRVGRVLRCRRGARQRREHGASRQHVGPRQRRHGGQYADRRFRDERRAIGHAGNRDDSRDGTSACRHGRERCDARTHDDALRCDFATDCE